MRIMTNPNRGRGGSTRGGSPHPQAWTNGVNGAVPSNGQTVAPAQTTANANASGEGATSPIVNGVHKPGSEHVRGGRGSRGAPRGLIPSQAPYSAFGPPRGGFMAQRGRGGFIPGADRGRGGFHPRGFRGRGRGGPPQAHVDQHNS